MRVAVVDGQGGGMGKAIVAKLNSELKDNVRVLALGTNSLATSVMLKAGASEGATGENAIVFNSNKVDVIMGPIAIIAANSLFGELTPNMAKSIAESPARKILIPLNRCNIQVVGSKDNTLPECIDEAVLMVKELASKKAISNNTLRER